MPSLLLQNFAELTQDPGAADDLRRLVLDLAVRGKLVDQDPTDEPASELLARIKAERARRVAAGELRKSKPLPEIKEEEIPFGLPEGWGWCRLGEVFQFDRGKSKHRPRNDKTLFEGGAIPFVQTGDVSQSKFKANKIGLPTKFYNDKGLAQSTLWPKGTLCITIAANIAETGFLQMNACFPDSVVGVIPLDENSYTSYLRYYLELTRTEIEKFAPATAQKNINLKIINELLFPIPPGREQKMIVKKVESLLFQTTSLRHAATHRQTLTNALIPSLLNGLAEAPDLGVFWREMIVPNFGLFTEQPAYCDQLRRLILDLAVRGRLVAQNEEDEPAAVLLERIQGERERMVKAGKIRKGKVFPEIGEEEVPFGLPEGWVWCRLGTVIHNFGQEQPQSEFTYIDVSSIDNKRGLLVSPKVLGTDQAPSRARKVVQPGCIVYSTVRPYLKNIIVVPETIPAAIASTAFCVMNALPGIETQFLLQYLFATPFNLYVEDKQWGQAYPAIKDKDLLNACIPLPPLPEQHRIVARVETLLEQVAELRTVAERKVSLRGQVLRAAIG